MHTTPLSSCLGILLLLALASSGPARAGTPSDAAARFPWLPAEWARRVVFYHSFEQGVAAPEINRLAGARISARPAGLSDGMTGSRGYHTRKAQQFALTSSGLSAHRPLTVMMWFRLDEPMTETGWFGLLSLGGHGRWISHDVRGKGKWCALREPTFVTQWHNFPDIDNVNQPQGGRASFDTGQWHHVAMTITGARQIDIYRDGCRRAGGQVTGRTFREGDTDTATFGAAWIAHPMTIDEVIVVDRVLRANEIADYFQHATALRERHFPQAAGFLTEQNQGNKR